MDIVNLMTWRFRNIEGVLDNIKSWDMDKCIFTTGDKISYDLKNGTVTIEKHSLFSPIVKTMKVEECTKKVLIEQFGFKERLDNRHSLSFEQKQED